jgi:putative ABC transport system permease protein
MSHSSGRAESPGTKVFRALLALYPAAFRDEYGRELTLLFIDRYRDATGPWDRATLWLDVLTGLAVEAPKEHCRMILQDLRYALRTLRRHGLVTITIVITLGLGIGANAAIFSLLNAVVLRTLPVSDPDRLFAVRAGFPLASGNRFSGPMVERLRQSAPPHVSVASMSRGIARVYTRTEGARDSEPAALQLVSSSYFQVLGIRPALGQLLPDEDGLRPVPLAVVSHRYWQQRFGGLEDVVGRTLTINGANFTIVGVGPQGFSGVWLESPVDVWVPLTMDRAVKYSQSFSADHANGNVQWLSQERIWWLDVIVRISPDQRAAVASAFNGGVPDFAKKDARLVLEPFAKGFSAFRHDVTTPLLALIGMAALVLLIACANVANLLLARAAGRQREIAVRMSLGAGRARLVHQLLTESILLVMMAGAAALFFARWAGDLLVRTATASTSGAAPFAAAIDLRVWGFTGAVALTSVVLFGLLPAWRTTRVDLAAALKAGARGTAGGSATRPARLLVVMQVALSLVLVTATGLLVRSFHNLLNVDIGLDRGHLLSVALEPRLAGGRSHELTADELADLQQRVLDSVASVPGVSSASLAMCGLHSTCGAREDGLQIEGYEARPDEQVVFLVNSVSPTYFTTIGTRLVAGRTFSDHDVEKAPKVAVVNRTLAAKYFENGQALGRRFGSTTKDVEIVGIVDDARLLSVSEAAVPTAYFPILQRPVPARSLEVRATGDPRQMIGSVRSAITRAAPDMPVESVAPIEERISVTLSQVRFVVFLASGFGALALGLAGFGLFGLLSYAVARRSSEFGIRIALGASRAQVQLSVIREALWLMLCGFLLGAPFVMLGGRLVSALVFGISPHDWTTFFGATIVLAAVGSACSVLPAWRASRVDPIVALRQE